MAHPTDVSDPRIEDAVRYTGTNLFQHLSLDLVIVFLGISKRYQNTNPYYRARNLLQLMLLTAVPITLGFPLGSITRSSSSGNRNVSNVVAMSSSVVRAMNITQHNRVCWIDADCVLYPTCKNRPSSCRCMSTGICILLRRYGQKCTSNDTCEDAMYCVLARNQNVDKEGPKITGVCRCDSNSRYNPFLRRCLKPSDEGGSTAEVMPRFSNFPNSGSEVAAVPQEIPATYGGGGDVPRFADLPDPGGEDADAPDEIPATYDGAILVGILSLSLVIVCLGLAMWCHYTSSRFRTQQLLYPLPQTHECLYSSSASLRRSLSLPPDDKGAENIPLGMFIPPPEMYQTPGFHNYLTINESVTSTSRTEETLSMLGAELSRTLR